MNFRLQIFLFSVYDNSVGSSIFVLIALSNLEQAHHKDSSMRYVLRNNLTIHNVRILYHNMSLVVLVLRPYGGPEEICTPVQNYFRLTSYDHTNWRLINLSPISFLNCSASFNVLNNLNNVATEPDS